MTRAEEMINMLEDEGYVVVSVRYADDTVVSFEVVEDDMADVVAIEVVTVDDYESNGYEVDGLETQWMEVR